MNAPIGRWLAVTAVPVMFGLGLGKLAMVLGGAGQGAYSDASWATSYVGSGPWESLNSSYTALPSQALEGALVLAAMLAVLILPPLLRFRIRRWRSFIRPGIAPRHPWSLLTGGRRYLTMLGLWSAMRLVAASTWRDAHVYNSLNAEQLILIGLIAIAVIGPAAASALVWAIRHGARAAVAGARGLVRMWRNRGEHAVVREPDAAKIQAVADAKGRVPSPAPDGTAALVHEVKVPVEDGWTSPAIATLVPPPDGPEPRVR
jgi:hypothetical protein